MKVDFDLNGINTIEFGVGHDDGKGRTFCLMAVDADVQSILHEMVKQTWNSMGAGKKFPVKYQPSEKYESAEYVYMPLSDKLATPLRKLHVANNLDLNAEALDEPSTMFCYFVKMTDKKGRRLTALRRSTQFKGILNKRLIRLTTNALKFIKTKVFKLDIDFDLLVDSNNIYILHPTSFEFASQLQEAVMAAAADNIKSIQKDLPFVVFDEVKEYASKHPRAARYLASIRASKETANIDQQLLKALCRITGVKIKVSGGKLIPDKTRIMDFLEVLDRRRYEINLVKDSPERYRAASRQKLGN